MNNYVILMTLSLLSTVSLANAMETKEEGEKGLPTPHNIVVSQVPLAGSMSAPLPRRQLQANHSKSADLIGQQQPKPKPKPICRTRKPHQENRRKLNSNYNIAKPGPNLPTINE
ncbi:MAG TPA: hypothetical protein VMW10_08280 [Alphaproteobacteria bacterium]|nr:hypothetical protein [Alphaproteobacteria bacterium]